VGGKKGGVKIGKKKRLKTQKWAERARSSANSTETWGGKGGNKVKKCYICKNKHNTKKAPAHHPNNTRKKRTDV